MTPNKLFETALGLSKPWNIEKIEFDADIRRLGIYIDFERGATFEYIDKETGEVEQCSAYDTKNKEWRHLIFFEHEYYIHSRTPQIKTAKAVIT